MNFHAFLSIPLSQLVPASSLDRVPHKKCPYEKCKAKVPREAGEQQ